MKDEVVDEVRKVREDQAARFSYDLKAILDDARKRQRTSGRPIVAAPTAPKAPLRS